MKIAVIGSCQAGPLSKALLLSASNIEKISYMQVNFLRDPAMRNNVENL